MRVYPTTECEPQSIEWRKSVRFLKKIFYRFVKNANIIGNPLGINAMILCLVGICSGNFLSSCNKTSAKMFCHKWINFSGSFGEIRKNLNCLEKALIFSGKSDIFL
jgi:hypothetical protein